jgi:hypothetical protein
MVLTPETANGVTRLYKGAIVEEVELLRMDINKSHWTFKVARLEL